MLPAKLALFFTDLSYITNFSELKISEDYKGNLIKLLSAPNITNKSYVYNCIFQSDDNYI